MSEEQSLIELTADIVSAHVSNNVVSLGDVATLVRSVHEALSGLGAEPAASAAEAKKVPAVSVRSSVKPEAITCLECGRKQKMLKRHLETAHGLTPAEYRAEFGLPASYPMVAPNYAQQRAELAKKIGLGRIPRKPASAGRGRRRPAARA
jgi:predicted transcriptional regulator